MKRLIVCMVALLMLVFPFAALAEGDAFAAEESWYELSQPGEVLTVRLPGNTESGLAWTYEISNPDALEMVTMETIVGEEEGTAGAPTTFVASFIAAGNQAENVALILRCAADEAEAAVYTRVLQLSVSAGKQITVSSVQEINPSADWIEMDEDECVLTVRMPSAEWSFDILDPAMVELITCDASSGSFVASFMASMTEIGRTEIVLTSEDGLESRTVNLFINESGMMSVEWVDEFRILQANDLTYCEKCFSWYEEGAAFENHACKAPETSAASVEFKTVGVTGNSVHMRANAGTNAESLMFLKKGENAKYLDETVTDASGMQWHKISFAGKTGWISAKYSKIGAQGYIKVVGGNCNMRKQPNLEGAVITSVNKDTVVTYLGEGSTDTRGCDWFKVSYNGKEGWMSSKYTAFTTNSKSTSNKTAYKYVSVTGDSHMRETAHKEGVSLMVIEKGATASYLGETAKDERGVEWYKISFGGKTGWISSKYTKLTNTSSEDSAEDEDDMRLVYNPNRYDVLRVSDIFSQDGKTYYIDGCFGTINSNGEPEKFDERDTVRLILNPGAEVLLPSDMDDPSSVDYVEDPAAWYAAICNSYDTNFKFYATFSMNESGAIRSLVFKPVD